MAGNRYTISLDLEQSTQSKQAIAQLNQAFTKANASVSEMGAAFVDLAGQIEDATALEKAFTGNVNSALAAKDKEIKALIKQQSLLDDINSTEYKSLENQIKALEAQKAQIKADSVHYKAVVKEAALKKKFARFFDPKEGIAGVKEQIKSFSTLAKSLKTVEGRMAALDKIQKKFTVGKGKLGGALGAVGKGVAGLAGAGAAIGGLALSQASGIAQKEGALKALKGASEADADRVFVATGADYSTIVNAINKLSAKFKGDDLIAAAIQEVKTPGVAGMLMAGGSGLDTSKLESVLDQIRKSAGSADLSAAISASQKARSVTNGNVSQTDYIAAYAALQNAGVDEERINAIIRSVASKGGDFIDTFNKTNLAGFVRGQQKAQVEGIKLDKIDPHKTNQKSPAERIQESINRVSLVKDKLLLNVMPKVAGIIERVLDSPTFQMVLDGVSRFADMVMPILEKTLNSLFPVIEQLLPPILDILEPVLRAVLPLIEKLTPLVVWALEIMRPVFEGLADVVDWLLSGKVLETITKAFSDIWEKVIKPGINSIIGFITSPIIAAVNAVIDGLNALPMVDGLEHVNAPQFAQGGIASVPSICGEHGAELVLPMNNPSRAQSLINNFNTTQNFTLMGAQTPLSLAQSIDSDRFIRHAARW